MRKEQVESTNIDYAGYDYQSGTLQVEFKSGKIYQYLEVGPDVWDEFMCADSKGRYLNQVIKKEFDFKQVDEEAAWIDVGSGLNLQKVF